MKSSLLIIAALLLASASASAADDTGLTRLAICQDSWLDWSKKDPAQMAKFGEHFRSQFSRKDGAAFFFPKKDVSVAGLRVVQAFPESVGMGVGFSLLVAAPFDKARAAVEKALGKPLKECETGDGMRSCALEIAEQRSVTLMAEDSPKTTQTLLGCYYYYEK